MLQNLVLQFVKRFVNINIVRELKCKLPTIPGFGAPTGVVSLVRVFQ
jgi:hypothetical protein